MDGERDQITEAAQALSELGAAKGGRARAEKLSPAERSGIARQAAEARWVSGRKNPPSRKATHEGVLKIGAMQIPCAVLEGGQRVLTQSGVMRALGRARQAKGRQFYDGDVNLPAFLTAKNLKPFISKELEVTSSQIEFKPLRGARAFGYPAELLPKVCGVFLDAEKQGVLLQGQKHIAERAQIIIRGLAHVGVVALIDEATGYQVDRARDELNKILEAYISRELLPWTKRFPEEFFKQLYRLRGWDYREGNNRRYRVVGKLVNKFVYAPLPPGVLSELKHKNPPNEKVYRQFKHHQFLSPDIGNEHLSKQLLEVTMLMRISDTQNDFDRLFKRAFSKQSEQMLIEYRQE